TTPGRLNGADLAAAEGMATLAAISLLSQRAASATGTTVDHLQFALNSRIVIEQAKGVLAERTGLGLDEAFERLRRYARANNQRLHDVAQAVVTGDRQAIA